MPTYTSEPKPTTAYTSEARTSDMFKPVINLALPRTINSVHLIVNQYKESIYQSETKPTTIYQSETRPN